MITQPTILLDVDNTMLDMTDACNKCYLQSKSDDDFFSFTGEFMHFRSRKSNIEDLRTFIWRSIQGQEYLTLRKFNELVVEWKANYAYHLLEQGVNQSAWEGDKLYNDGCVVSDGFYNFMSSLDNRYNVQVLTLSHISTAKTKFDLIDNILSLSDLHKDNYSINMLLSNDVWKENMDKSLMNCDIVIEDNLDTLLSYRQRYGNGKRLFLKMNLVNSFANPSFLSNQGIETFYSFDELSRSI